MSHKEKRWLEIQYGYVNCVVFYKGGLNMVKVIQILFVAMISDYFGGSLCSNYRGLHVYVTMLE